MCEEQLSNDFTKFMCEHIYESCDFTEEELYAFCMDLYERLKIHYIKKNNEQECKSDSECESDSDYDPNEPSDYEDD